MTEEEIQEAIKQLAQEKSNINHRNLNASSDNEKYGEVV